MSTPKYGLPAEVKFCTRCVISNQRPNSVPEYGHTAASKKTTIHFDSEGVCDACRVAEAKALVDWDVRERELVALCDQHRGSGRAYDCIVPGSGGKDSFYAAHVLREKYGMRPLTVTWSPHIFTDCGWRNFQRWTGIADNWLHTPRVETHRLLTRIAVETLFHPFQPFIFGQKSIAAKVAARYKIPLIFYGENEAEYGDPRGHITSAKRARSFHAYGGDLHLGGLGMRELAAYGLTEADLEPYMPLGGYETLEIDVRYLGYYLRWHPQSAYYYACEHGGFEAAPERTPGTYSKYNSIDDKMDDFHYWTTYQKFGIGRATYDAAQEIRSDDIDRDEGVRLVHRYDGEWPHRFAAEVNEYLSVPGFQPMTDDRWWELARKFRSSHLWDGDTLLHRVS